MKLTFLFLSIVFFTVSANSFSQVGKVTIRMENATLSKVFDEIEAQTNYALFYKKDVINDQRIVSVNAVNAEVRDVLNDLLAGDDLAYKVLDNSIVIASSSLLDTDSGRVMQQQARTISGNVKDGFGDLIPGVSVFVKGTAIGTVTDIDGNFSLTVPDESAILVFSFIGMKTQELPLGTQSIFEVVLEDDAIGLNEIVVTALGIKKEERAVSYNVQTIASNDFLSLDPSFMNSLSGKLAGVHINPSSAGIGGETKVVMRGNKSISGGNNVLYVVDGIPMPDLSLTEPGKNYTMYEGSKISGGGISNLNPEDFESISVLTGPSAAALYGSTAANGVIMITTKNGTEQTSVTYSTNTSFSSPFWLPEFQNSYGAKDGAYSSWGSKLSAPSSWEPKDFFQTGYNTTHNLGLSTGNEKSKTYLSAGFVEARGLIKNNEFGRKNFSANNTTSFLDDKMQLSLSGMYINVDEQNMLAGGQYYNPLIPIYLKSPSDDINKYAVYERYDATRNFPVQYWPWGSQSLQMQNPYWTINRDMFNTQKDRFIFTSSLNYDVLEWLSVSGRARIDYNTSTLEQKNNASTLGLFAGVNGRYYWEQYMTRQNYGDIMLNIDKYFLDDKLSLTAVIGASVQDLKYRSSLIGGDLLGVPNLFTFANMDISKSFVKNSVNDQTQAIFATAQLGWKRMVYLDLTARNDWSSAIVNAKDESILYPSAGLSAIITDVFNIDSKVLSFSKVRVSYAEVGNSPMRYLTIPTYTVSSGTPQTLTYLAPDDFEPERTKSWEFGVDTRLWGNTLILGGTYYTSRTFNQVFEADLPGSSTKNMIYINAGRVDNNGFELSAELNMNISKIKWTSNLIYSRNKNKIVKLVDNYKLSTGEVININSLDMGGTTGVKMLVKEGGKIGDLYVNTLKTDEHGYIWVSPTSNSVSADKNNFIYAGNSNPSYMMSWGNNFNWKGISFAFMVNARVGGVGVSLTQATMDFFGVSEASADARDNGGVLVNGVRIPAESYYQVTGGNGVDAVGASYVYSMTNVRLSEVSLGYDVPINKWVSWLKEMNVSIVGNNLLMLYCKAPFDPELVAGTGTYSSGVDYFQLPSTRNVGFSAKFKF